MFFLQTEEHLDSAFTGGDTSSSSGGPLSQSNSASNVVKTISTLIPANGNVTPATTTRTIFKRSLDTKSSKLENARKNARFDDLRQ